MSKLSKMHSIEQFRNVIRHVTDNVRYRGRDENNNPIFDPNVLLPTLTFRGTTKIHGTNAAIGYDYTTQEMWTQSKESIITPLNDNAGFSSYVFGNENFFKPMLAVIAKTLLQHGYELGEKYSGFIMYAEWCGGSIQKGVAVNQLPKMCVVFSLKLLSNNLEEDGNTWIPDELCKELIVNCEQHKFFNIWTFGEWLVDIDFNNPHLIQNKLVELTDQVEKECPVGKFFGVSATGEGIVWKCITEPFIGSNYQFKVKGEKHSSTKIKTIAAIDVEKVNSINECVEKIVTENRLKQGIEQLQLNHLEMIPENLGFFIKWVVQDCVKEELDTIVESGLIVKDVNSAISKKARNWFFELYNNGIDI